jgi:hypothetical protein
MRVSPVGLALGVKGRLDRSSNCWSLLHRPKGIELTDALGLTRGRFIEDRAPAALFAPNQGLFKEDRGFIDG